MIKDDEVVNTLLSISYSRSSRFGNLFHRFKRTMPVLGRSELPVKHGQHAFILKTSY
jgi:hypothetical protein